MQIEKRMILFLIALAVVISIVVYWATHRAYDNAPKDGTVISVEQRQAIPTPTPGTSDAPNGEPNGEANRQ